MFTKYGRVDGTVIDDFLIDETRELKYMIKCHSEGSDEYAISDKVIAFRVYGHWGVMDKHAGRVLVPARYGDVSLASENVIKCSIDRRGDDDNVLFDLRDVKWFFDRLGRVVSKFRHIRGNWRLLDEMREEAERTVRERIRR